MTAFEFIGVHRRHPNAGHKLLVGNLNQEHQSFPENTFPVLYNFYRLNAIFLPFTRPYSSMISFPVPLPPILKHPFSMGYFSKSLRFLLTNDTKYSIVSRGKGKNLYIFPVLEVDL